MWERPLQLHIVVSEFSCHVHKGINFGCYLRSPLGSCRRSGGKIVAPQHCLLAILRFERDRITLWGCSYAITTIIHEQIKSVNSSIRREWSVACGRWANIIKVMHVTLVAGTQSQL
eukprot:65393-Amphidinium_carterae.1